MEIQALKLLITDKDLNELVAKHLPDDQPLEHVHVRITPGGVHVTGQYPLLVSVHFETVWELHVKAGKLVAELSSLKAMGLPAMVFKSAVLKAVEEAIQHKDWLSFEADTLVVNVDQLLAGAGLHAKTNLGTVRCLAGELLIECP